MSVIMPNASTHRGFTIVELMVTMAVAAILMGIAIPAFNDFIAQRTMASRVNDFVVAVTYARSEAARRGGIVSIQAVDASDGDNEWGPGYCVVEGNPGNCNDALRRFEAMDDATLTEFAKISKKYLDELSAKHPDVKKALDSQEQFKRDFADWREQRGRVAPWPIEDYIKGKHTQ